MMNMTNLVQDNAIQLLLIRGKLNQLVKQNYFPTRQSKRIRTNV